MGIRSDKARIIFREETHEYFLDGKKVPSVTEVIPHFDFSRIDPEVLERSQEFGKAVHKATELYDLGTLNIDDLDPHLKGYLEAYIQFKKDFDFLPHKSEWIVFSDAYKYAGTLDTMGTYKKRKGDVPRWCLIDVKTGTPGPEVELQLSGYLIAAKDMDKKLFVKQGNVDLFCLVLMDGKYKVEEVEYNPCAFLSFLNTHNWRLKKGVKY